MTDRMFFALMVIFMFCIMGLSRCAYAQNWDNNPSNWNNNVSNWDNNPSNWNNNVHNWDNNPSNPYTNNGVYNNQGQRIGYETKAPSGVTNVYDNNGNRVGYKSAK